MLWLFFLQIHSVNGIPACANKRLLTDILRDTWNFTGFVISDSGALEFIILNHHYIDNIQKTAVVCAKAGVNLELHAGQYARGVFDWLKDAEYQKQISKVKWAVTQQNLSSGFPTKQYSNQLLQLQRRARRLKF